MVEATREVDVRSQVVRDNTVYVLKNTGSSAVKYFVVGFRESAERVAHVSASAKKGGALKPGRRTEVAGASEGVFFRIDLAGSGLAAGSEMTVTVDTAITQALSPHPAEIGQAEQQFVVLETSSRVVSPYAVASQKSTIRLPPGSLESFTKDLPSKHEGEKVTYGPYEAVPALTVSPVKLHLENNSPFLVVNKLERVIEISNWGNVAVEETLQITHAGAKLKGSFSRFDFQRDRRERMPAVQSFKTILPAAARDVYYRDEIGNISTSHLREMDEAVELEIRPRFPLFGGWKSNYYIGYNVPSYEYLFSKGSAFALKMRFLDHIFDNFVVEEMTLKVILPEGSRDVKLNAPYAVEREADAKHATYLDISGRPVVIAHKKNLVEAHIADFTLNYTFERLSMFREPLMLIVAFYLFFFAVIVYVRLDFTIAKDPGSEARLKVAGLIEKVTAETVERGRAYDAWGEAVTAFKANKDSSSLASGKKKAEAALKATSGALGEMQAQLKSEGAAEAAEKLSELSRLDKTAREHLANWTTAAERLVAGKLKKDAYSEAEKQTKTKMDELRDKMDSIVYSL